MRQTEERYISLLTDFGFKRIFGTKLNKSLLISFLNSLFDGEQVIRDVKYLNSEHVGDVHTERKAIFDVYCENEHGEKFIVEMQNAYQTYFKDRSLYYATFLRNNQYYSRVIRFYYGKLSLTHNAPYPSCGFGHTSYPGRCLAPRARYAFTFSP